MAYMGACQKHGNESKTNISLGKSLKILREFELFRNPRANKRQIGGYF